MSFLVRTLTSVFYLFSYFLAKDEVNYFSLVHEDGSGVCPMDGNGNTLCQIPTSNHLVIQEN